MASDKKLSILDSLIDLLKNNPSFTLVKFEKTTHIQLEALRKSLRNNNALFKVVKNSILLKALNKLSADKKEFSELKQKISPLKENTAVVGLNGEWSSGLKAFHEFIQKEKTLSYKVGILDGQVYLADTLERIAKLPGKTQLYGQLLSSMKSPMTNLVYSMKFNMTKFVYILSEKAKKA